jgi:hypothetical protein
MAMLIPTWHKAPFKWLKDQSLADEQSAGLFILWSGY